ncbi:MAG: sigma-70 family RNA polymerase sigma factor [Planctomycetota bacterium]
MTRADRRSGAPTAAPGGSAGAEPPDDPGGALMVRWCDTGDEAAFEELVELYSGRIFALVTRFLGRRSGRDDLVQEVFVRIVRARDRYEPTARFSTWLYSIVYRMCVNETQRARSAVSIDAGEDGPLQIEDESAALPDAASERADAVRAVREAIASLPENQRIAVVLARYHGLAYAEIAETVGSSPKAIKSLIHRARETLRERLQPFLVSTGDVLAGEDPH